MYNRRRQKGLRLFFENHFLKIFGETAGLPSICTGAGIKKYEAA